MARAIVLTEIRRQKECQIEMLSHSVDVERSRSNGFRREFAGKSSEVMGEATADGTEWSGRIKKNKCENSRKFECGTVAQMIMLLNVGEKFVPKNDFYIFSSEMYSSCRNII